MIGAGIVAMPTVLASNVGPAGILSCILSALSVMFIGVSIGRAAEICPGEGWNYLYPSKWGGHWLGMVSASCYLLGLITGLGFLAQQVGVWFHSFLPFITAPQFKYIIMITIMLLILAGTKTSAVVQHLIISFVVIPLAITAIFCWFHFNPNLVFPFMPYGISSVMTGASKIMFALIGFESIISLYGVIKNPTKNVPRAFVLAIGAVGLIYIFFFYGILFAIPKHYFAKGLDDTLANILLNAFPKAHILSNMVLIGAVFGILGTLHSMVWSISSLFTTVLKKAKSTGIKVALQKNIWNNKISVIVTTTLILLSSVFIKLEDLLYVTVLFVALSYMLSIMYLLFIKKEWQTGRNFITLLGLGGGSLIIYFALKNIMLAFWG
jgi:APA family basic amino acid/polyamine antiporter